MAGPADYGYLMEALAHGAVDPGHPGDEGQERVVVRYEIGGGESLRAVFEVRPGRRNRALVLISMVIKT